MPRYLIEKTFPGRLEIPMTTKGVYVPRKVVSRKKKTFCICYL